jgi:glucokinase
MPDLHSPPGRTHVGIDIGGTKLLVLICTHNERQTFRFPTGPAAGPEAILAHIQPLLAQWPDPTIGIAIPGIVDAAGRVQDCDVLPKLAGWQPAASLPNVKAVLNDGEAALETVAAGHGPDATVAAIGIGTGIAAAFQIAGRRLRRYRPYAGELGFAPYGATQTFDEAASGATVAANPAGLAQAAEAFGASLVTVLHLIHPEAIGLYGGTLKWPGYTEGALAAYERRAHPLLKQHCRVEVLPDPDLVVAKGAILAT